MDRQIIYPSAIPLDTDQLSQTRNALIGFGVALKAILGSSTLVDGLACTATSPASLQVNIAAGSIYSLQNVDDAAFGSLAADTAHQIIKQGVVLDVTTTAVLAAPVTVGYSINYLIEAAYQDLDAVPVTLPYYNASNPSVPYSGPSNSGTAQNTVRKGKCVLQVKVGTAATTGTQTTPAVDSGFTALWVVTVAYGQTTITSGNIVLASGAPFIGDKLTARLSSSKNLSDVASAATALANLGGLKSSNNLSDLSSLPTTLTNLGFSSGTGWVKLPDGTIIQRGTAGFAGTTGQVVTFPRSFPTACESFVATADGSNSGGSDVVEYVGAPTTTTQAVQLSTGATGAFVAGYLQYTAIGK